MSDQQMLLDGISNEMANQMPVAVGANGGFFSIKAHAYAVITLVNADDGQITIWLYNPWGNNDRFEGDPSMPAGVEYHDGGYLSMPFDVFASNFTDISFGLDG